MSRKVSPVLVVVVVAFFAFFFVFGALSGEIFRRRSKDAASTAQAQVRKKI